MSDDVWYACVFFAEEVPARVSKDVKFKKNNTSGKTWDILFLCETKKDFRKCVPPLFDISTLNV